MLNKKISSLLLAIGLGLGFGFSLNTGAENPAINPEVLTIFKCENEEQLKGLFTSVGCVGIVNKSLKDLQPNFSDSQVFNLCVHFSDYYDALRATAAKNEEFTNFQQRDAIITEVTKVVTENKKFKKQLDKIINSKTKHSSFDGNTTSSFINGRSVRGKIRRHPDGQTSGSW